MRISTDVCQSRWAGKRCPHLPFLEQISPSLHDAVFSSPYRDLCHRILYLSRGNIPFSCARASLTMPHIRCWVEERTRADSPSFCYDARRCLQRTKSPQISSPSSSPILRTRRASWTSSATQRASLALTSGCIRPRSGLHKLLKCPYLHLDLIFYSARR